jgi:hypothetical protein
MEKITKTGIKLDLPEYVQYLNKLIYDNSVLKDSFQGITFSISTEQVDFYFDEITDEITIELDNLVFSFLDNYETYNLMALKEEKKQLINNRTDELLLIGYNYGDIYFPILPEDQRNYLGLNVAALNQLVTSQPILTFGEGGVKVKGHDSDGNTLYHSFVDCGDIINFFMTGMGFVNQTLSSGWELKDQINNASSIDELNAIEDNR